MAEMGDAKANKAYIDTLPLWGEGWQQDGSSIDGLVPACRVGSWQEFIEVMREEQFNKASSELVFRGQRGCDWPLASTLSRKFNSGSIPPLHRKKMLHKFELAMRGRGYDLSLLSDEIEKWAIGQHHGLATPLLDWTRSPFVALFFAFNRADGGEKENPSRAIFCLNRSAITAAFDDNEDFFLEPLSSNNSRLVNQAGLFTLSPSGEDNISAFIINKLQNEEIVVPAARTVSRVADRDGDGKTETEYEVADDLAEQLAQFIFKIHVPNNGRLDCLEMLRKMNIHNGSLFPDAVGASLYCNDWLDRVLAEEALAKHLDAERQASREARGQHHILEIDEAIKLHAEAATTSTSASPQLLSIIKTKLAEFGEQNVDAGALAEKIDNKFQTERSIDWHLSEHKKARIRMGFRRLLLALGHPETLVSELIDELMNFYEKKSER